MHILVGHEDEPEVVVAEGGAGAEMEALVPPVEHIAFGELMGRMVENLAACVCRVAIEDRHDVLQLVAEACGTAHLVEAGTREETRGVDLVEIPAVEHVVESRVGRLHLYGGEFGVPIVDHALELGVDGFK